MVTQGANAANAENISDQDDISTQEQHWGEILERTCSKQNLMFLNGNGAIVFNQQQETTQQQIFPGRKLKIDPLAASTLSLEMLRPVSAAGKRNGGIAEAHYNT